MTAVNTNVLVNMRTVSNVAKDKIQGNVATDGASFKEVLAKTMPTRDEISNSDDTESGTDVKDMVAKLLQCGTDKDIEQLLDGLSSEQLDMLTDIIQKITQLISQESNVTDGTDNQPITDAIMSIIGKQNETDDTQQKVGTSNIIVSGDTDKIQQKAETSQIQEKSKTVDKVSDEVLSDIVSAIVEISNVPLQDVSADVSKTAENIAQEIIQNVSENSKGKLVNSENMLSNLLDKVSKSNPQLSEFATKLQHISGEISKTFNALGEQLPQMKITDVKVSTTPEMQQSTKENSVILNESFDKTLIKVSKNESELSELTALTGNVKTDVVATQGEQIKTVDAPIENQVLNFIKTEVLPSAKSSGTTEMTMTLTPEELGKISIKLVNTGAELTVAISCDNSITQKLIESRLPQLISNLSSGENKIVDVTVTPNQNASQFMNNFSMSQQNNHQQFQSQHSQTHYFENKETNNKLEQPQEVYREGRLWQTV